LNKAVAFAKEALQTAVRDREFKIVVQQECEQRANTTDTETREAVDNFEANYALFIQGTVAELAVVKQQIRENKEKFIRIVRAVIVAFRDSINDVHVTFGANLDDNTNSLDVYFVLYDNGVAGEVTAERKERHRALLKSLLASQCGQKQVAVDDAATRKRQNGDSYVGTAGTPPPATTTGSQPPASTTGGNPPTSGNTPNPPTSGNTPNPPSTGNTNPPGSSATTVVGSFVLMLCVLAVSLVF